MNATTLIVKKIINAPCQKVFDAWSKPEVIEKWFYPPEIYWSAAASNEFKVGGHYKLEMLKQDGVVYSHTGEYKEIIPNKKIVFTFNSNLVSNTLVTVELRAIENKTEITLTHELFPNEEMCARHQMGWEGCLENMDHFFLGKNPTI
jgi:uncharacterized protein YndB with AHSA1/START domain